MRTLIKPARRGRPAKYKPILAAMAEGQTIEVWQGMSPRYAMRLAWQINTARIPIPEGNYQAQRLFDPDEREWVVQVTRS